MTKNSSYEYSFFLYKENLPYQSRFSNCRLLHKKHQKQKWLSVQKVLLHLTQFEFNSISQYLMKSANSNDDVSEIFAIFILYIWTFVKLYYLILKMLNTIHLFWKTVNFELQKIILDFYSSVKFVGKYIWSRLIQRLRNMRGERYYVGVLFCHLSFFLHFD